GVSIPLFMHVGVVRMRWESRRTERLPSDATIFARSYIQRPATQMSRRCCFSLFAEPGRRASVDTASSLLAPNYLRNPAGKQVILKLARRGARRITRPWNQ